MNDCRRFIREICTAAELATREPSLETRARMLARRLLDDYVPPASVLGVSVRRVILGERTAPGSRAAASSETEARGFSAQFTDGGQEGEALRHIAAAAAAVLMDKKYLVTIANAFDTVQGMLRGNPAEARAEVAGNRAGSELGRHLLAYLAGQYGKERLETELERLLCGAGRQF